MKDMIKSIVADREIYARFLNTLSLLEYIGARKILKSQAQENINEKILAHVSEEIRHAQVLKKIAIKIAPGLCDTYKIEALFCGREAGQYFQTVDRAVEKLLADVNPWHAYLFTTLLIELRATDFYQQFEDILQSLGETAFRGILVEEERHLNEVLNWIESVPNYSEKLVALKKIEEAAFFNFMASMEQVLKNRESVA